MVLLTFDLLPMLFRILYDSGSDPDLTFQVITDPDLNQKVISVTDPEPTKVSDPSGSGSTTLL